MRGDHSTPFVTEIRPTQGRFVTTLGLQELIDGRELIRFLVWRDIRVRYKQTALGMTWIVLQPALSVLIFTILFDVLLGVESAVAPYPVLLLAALLPWQYFSTALQRGSLSIVESSNLITKIYFPRLIVPIAAVCSGLVDLAVSFAVYVVLAMAYQVPPNARVLLLPLFVLLAVVTALGFSFWLAALNVRYRDVKHVVPFMVQMWMYATPVVYSVDLIAGALPPRYRWVLGLNPMTGVVQGFRWSLLDVSAVQLGVSPGLIAISSFGSLLVLLSGAFYFRATERYFADIV